MVAAIVLAAGASSRFTGGHKLLADIDGQAVIRRVVDEILKSKADDIVVVAGANSAAIEDALGHGAWRIVVNPDATSGLSSSLRVGLNAVPDADGALIVLGDMPGITAALVDRLIGAFDERGRRSIVFPQGADGRRGHPVLWPRALFPDLTALSGDTGGRALLDAHRASWRPVPTDDDGAFTDIDTRDDLQAFAKRQR